MPAGSLKLCAVPAAAGAGAPETGVAAAKFSGVIGVAEVTTSYGGAGEHLRVGPRARDVADGLAGDEREVVVDRREAGRELAGVRLPGGREVLAALLVVGRHDVERAQQAGDGAEEVGRRAVERA